MLSTLQYLFRALIWLKMSMRKKDNQIASKTLLCETSLTACFWMMFSPNKTKLPSVQLFLVKFFSHREPIQDEVSGSVNTSVSLFVSKYSAHKSLWDIPSTLTETSCVIQSSLEQGQPGMIGTPIKWLGLGIAMATTLHSSRERR